MLGKYYLDGYCIDTKTEIPYKTVLQTNLISHGATFTIVAHGETSDDSKTYTLTKNGVYVTIE